MIDKRMREVWGSLRGRKAYMPQFLSAVSLKGLRGISGLRVMFDYPVSVIAGGNGSGKSTVLFAAACAYKVPGSGIKDFVPSTLFPDYSPELGPYKDEKRQTELAFDYATPEGNLAMRWRRGKSGWNRSFLGRTGGRQPERPVYLRTLGNLSNPSEVRSVLRMSHMKTAPEESPLTPLQIEFAQRILPFHYSKVVALSRDGEKAGGRRNLLFAAQEGGAAYSELHMAAGERALLRLSRRIAHLKGALVLIDEIEAGLHPWAQELLMLRLQDLALRKDLQIIVTTHSSVVLDSVPREARIFLERDDTGRVTMSEPHRDIVQTALYGRSSETLRLLCEDDAAEGVVRGVMDRLAPQLELKGESVQVGRDTGAEEFPGHVSAFVKFGMVRSFVFVLDGDKRESDVKAKIEKKAGEDAPPVLFLPGQGAPEVWVWECLQGENVNIAKELGLAEVDLAGRTRRLDSIYDFASGGQSEIAKAKIRGLSENIKRSAPEICRIVARIESDRDESSIQPLVSELERVLLRWRMVGSAT